MLQYADLNSSVISSSGAGGTAHLMCSYCNYTSPKRYLLARHLKAHSEERPHKCNICSRMFKTIPALQNHVNTHTGVRPQHCKVVSILGYCITDLFTPLPHVSPKSHRIGLIHYLARLAYRSLNQALVL